MWQSAWIPFGHALVYSLCPLYFVCQKKKRRTLIYGLRNQLKEITKKTTGILAGSRKKSRKKDICCTSKQLS